MSNVINRHGQLSVLPMLKTSMQNKPITKNAAAKTIKQKRRGDEKQEQIFRPRPVAQRGPQPFAGDRPNTRRSGRVIGICFGPMAQIERRSSSPRSQ